MNSSLNDISSPLNYYIQGDMQNQNINFKENNWNDLNNNDAFNNNGYNNMNMGMGNMMIQMNQMSSLFGMDYTTSYGNIPGYNNFYKNINQINN